MKRLKNIVFYALTSMLASMSVAAVNINTATQSELEALPGVGPAKAKAIVEYRKEHGQFKSVEDLKNVKGIGEGIYGKLKDEATVGGVKKAPAAAAPAVKSPEKKP